MIVTELLGQNLYDYSMDPMFIGMPRDLLKSVAAQILNALKHLRDIRIIHGDLKPENIVFTNQHMKNVKLIDFGIAQPESRLIHGYVQSRAYRSPEVVLGLQLTCAIDMWSFGCILVEMVTGKPLFLPIDEKELLEQIRLRIGRPSLAMLENARRKSELYDKNNELIRSLRSRI